jgi:hypothetical protein
MRVVRAVSLAFALATFSLPPVLAESTAAPQAQIRELMRGTFHRLEAPLAVDPVVVQGDHALAGWAQGDLGGRALLVRKHGKWMIAFCSGDALRDAKKLTDLGVPKASAEKLAADLAAAEAKLDPKRVAMFSRFDGLVKMDEHGAHPPGHGQHPPAHDAPKKHTH